MSCFLQLTCATINLFWWNKADMSTKKQPLQSEASLLISLISLTYIVKILIFNLSTMLLFCFTKPCWADLQSSLRWTAKMKILLQMLETNYLGCCSGPTTQNSTLCWCASWTEYPDLSDIPMSNAWSLLCTPSIKAFQTSSVPTSGKTSEICRSFRSFWTCSTLLRELRSVEML